MAEINGCTQMVFLGDFFDKSSLNAQEITALKEVRWSTMKKYFLIGNHESNISTLEFSATHLFYMCPNSQIIDTPITEYWGNTNVLWLPYITESNRKQLLNYYKPCTNKQQNKLIIFSHNDLAGYQYGGFLSVDGFPIDDVKSACDLFVNGHLHNGEIINEKMINLGNLTGQNFSEDAFTYKHHIMILDTDTLRYELIENPEALKFYKLTSPGQIKKLGNNAIVSIKVKESEVEETKRLLEKSENIIESRLLIEPESTGETKNTQIELTHMDHIQQFNQFVFDTIGTSDIIKEELLAISGG